MDYKKTRWRDITHELTGQVQFRPENSRRPLNIPIREIQKKDNGLSEPTVFAIIVTLPFSIALIAIVWGLYEIFFN